MDQNDRSFLEIAIKAGLSAFDPICGLIVVGSWPPAQKTEKYVAGWPHDDSYMTMPDNQIASLWMKNSPEALDTVIEVVGRRIFVRKARTLVNRMYKM